MKCPLLAIAWAGVVAKQPESYPDCLKEECAWWVETTQRCAVAQLATDSVIISSELHQLVDKMPHARQFLK